MKKTHTIAKAIGQSPRKQAEYAAQREAITAANIRTTAKPRKKKVRPAEVEQLKHRAESIEGSEVVEIALGTLLKPNEIGGTVFADDTAGMPPEGFQGA